MRPYVSVIIPVYNVEKYIEKCLMTIMSQTFTDYEVILVNDGSTDGSLNIINQYLAKHENMYLYNQKNKGLSAARNAGMKQARGEYYVFVDSDDWVSEDFLEIMVKYARIYHADLVSIPDCRVNQAEEESASRNGLRIFKKNSANALLGFYDTNYAWGKLIRSCLMEDVLFPEGKRYEDIGTMYKIYDKANIVILADSGRYYYRYRTDSITGSRRISDVNDKVCFIKEIKQYSFRASYAYLDFYILVKLFGAMADLYKIENLSDVELMRYKKIIYSLSESCKLPLRAFIRWRAFPKALLMKTRLADVCLGMKYRQ